MEEDRGEHAEAGERDRELEAFLVALREFTGHALDEPDLGPALDKVLSHGPLHAGVTLGALSFATDDDGNLDNDSAFEPTPINAMPSHSMAGMRSPKISIRSVTSVRAVSTNRSARAFARGLRGGIFTASIPAPCCSAPPHSLSAPLACRAPARFPSLKDSRPAPKTLPVTGAVARSFTTDGVNLALVAGKSVQLASLTDTSALAWHRRLC